MRHTTNNVGVHRQHGFRRHHHACNQEGTSASSGTLVDASAGVQLDKSMRSVTASSQDRIRISTHATLLHPVRYKDMVTTDCALEAIVHDILCAATVSPIRCCFLQQQQQTLVSGGTTMCKLTCG